MIDAPPPTLIEIVTRWQQQRTEQEPIPWPRERWASSLPEHADFIGGLPPALDRAIACALGEEAHTSPLAAIRALIVTMAWGYANNGYGPMRTARVLATPDAGLKLIQAATLAHDGDPLGAYEVLSSSRGRLRGLGQSFGTKFIAFCSSRSAYPALILDANVIDWLASNSTLHLRPTWHLPSYRQYMAAVYAWATTLGLTAQEVEFCMFASQLKPTSQWAAGSRLA